MVRLLGSSAHEPSNLLEGISSQFVPVGIVAWH